MQIQLSDLPDAILAALATASPTEAGRYASAISDAAEKGEIGVSARSLKDSLPGLERICAQWDGGVDDNGESYTEWLGVMLVFADGRTITLNGSASNDESEFLSTHSDDDEENRQWLDIAEEFQKANPDCEMDQAWLHAVSVGLGVPADTVSDRFNRVWNLIDHCEQKAMSGPLVLDELIAAATPCKPSG